MFANITNFNDFYSESYEGGLECLRVLNELISDFDDLLMSEEFECIEKIKTIGSTYMVASGLSSESCCHQPSSNIHLLALLNFGLRLKEIVADFNQNMLGFNFKVRIGFNYGPLTAGVVGTSKLLYDIWGDTVNVASRMESTGVEGSIQVSRTLLPAMRWLTADLITIARLLCILALHQRLCMHHNKASRTAS